MSVDNAHHASLVEAAAASEFRHFALAKPQPAGATILGDGAGAIIYNCDPQANHRAIVRVNELCRLRVSKGTREEAIETVWRELDRQAKD